MVSSGYEDLLERLTPDARTIFCEMADAHLASGPGDRLFLRADTMSGTGMIFTGRGARQNWRNFDGGALDDLVSYGLLHQGFGSRGSPNYRVSGEGLHFYRWLMEREGDALAQVEENVLRLLSNADFARLHPEASHHLNEAFDLLWSDTLSDEAISEIGDHLRKSLMDTVNGILPKQAPGAREKPVARLDAWLHEHTGLSTRESAALRQLVEFTRVVLRLDHRLNHVRDEVDRGEAKPTTEEVRRAAFLTTLICFELDRIDRRD